MVEQRIKELAMELVAELFSCAAVVAVEELPSHVVVECPQATMHILITERGPVAVAAPRDAELTIEVRRGEVVVRGLPKRREG